MYQSVWFSSSFTFHLIMDEDSIDCDDNYYDTDDDVEECAIREESFQEDKGENFFYCIDSELLTVTLC